MLTNTAQSKYQVGQIWNYQTRPQDIGSTVTIVKVEHHPKLGNIVHINIQGLKIKSPRYNSDGITQTITHVPISEEALAESNMSLLQERAELPEFAEGYREWRQAFDAGQAGVFGIPVAQVVDAMETVLNQ